MNNDIDADVEKLFSFVQCWTCSHLLYDILTRKHRCPHLGIDIDKPHEPTDCKDWTRT